MASLTTSAGLPRPEIEESGDYVMVCFRHGQIVRSQRDDSDLTDQQRAVLDLLDSQTKRWRYGKSVPSWGRRLTSGDCGRTSPL